MQKIWFQVLKFFSQPNYKNVRQVAFTNTKTSQFLTPKALKTLTSSEYVFDPIFANNKELSFVPFKEDSTIVKLRKFHKRKYLNFRTKLGKQLYKELGTIDGTKCFELFKNLNSAIILGNSPKKVVTSGLDNKMSFIDKTKPLILKNKLNIEKLSKIEDFNVKDHISVTFSGKILKSVEEPKLIRTHLVKCSDQVKVGQLIYSIITEQVPVYEDDEIFDFNEKSLKQRKERNIKNIPLKLSNYQALCPKGKFYYYYINSRGNRVINSNKPVTFGREYPQYNPITGTLGNGRIKKVTNEGTFIIENYVGIQKLIGTTKKCEWQICLF